jgi:hypothetical protein
MAVVSTEMFCVESTPVGQPLVSVETIGAMIVSRGKISHLGGCEILPPGWDLKYYTPTFQNHTSQNYLP